MSEPHRRIDRTHQVLLAAVVFSGVSWGVAAVWQVPARTPALWAAEGARAPAVATPPASHFAEADLLAAEVEALLLAAARDLADEAAFRKVGDLRNGDAAALATLLMVLAVHDGETKYRPVAAQAIPLAVEMANAHKYAPAREAWGKLQTVLRMPPKIDPGKKPEQAKWSAPATGEPLLYFVESRYNQLERDLGEESFGKQTARSTRAAAVLAALGAAMSHETEYGTTAEKGEIWRTQSLEWRDSAALVGKAIRAGDRPGALKAFDRLGQSCTTCHDAFNVDQ